MKKEISDLYKVMLIGKIPINKIFGHKRARYNNSYTMKIGRSYVCPADIRKFLENNVFTGSKYNHKLRLSHDNDNR